MVLMELFEINHMLIYSRLDAFRQNIDTIFFTPTALDNLVYCGWNNLSLECDT
jgi:hypothetical protein